MISLSATNETSATSVGGSQPIAEINRLYPLSQRPILPYPRPTVSLDPRPVVIPILSCVICFPVVAFAIICALRYRAQRSRKKDRLRRLQAGYRSATLDIPNREKPSLFSRDSSSDLRAAAEKSDCGSPACPSEHSWREPSRKNSQATFITAAVMHVPEFVNHNGRLKHGSKAVVSFWEDSSQIEDTHELAEELRHSISR